MIGTVEGKATMYNSVCLPKPEFVISLHDDEVNIESVRTLANRMFGALSEGRGRTTWDNLFDRIVIEWDVRGEDRQVSNILHSQKAKRLWFVIKDPDPVQEGSK